MTDKPNIHHPGCAKSGLCCDWVKSPCCAIYGPTCRLFVIRGNAIVCALVNRSSSLATAIAAATN